MKNLKLLTVNICFILCLTACASTTESNDKSGGYTISKIDTPADLIVLTDGQCLLAPISKETASTESAEILALLAATLVEAAVTKGFEAFNEYAIAKATEDTEGKTFTANTIASAVTTSVKTVDNKLVSDSKLDIGCITVIKESKATLTDSDWIDKMEEKTSLGQKIGGILKSNQITHIPSLFFQIGISNSIDRTSYIVEPVILSYMHRLGAKKSSKDMDIAITIEISEPGKSDSPSLQLVFTYKDLKPQQVYLNDTKSFYSQTAYPALKSDTLLSKELTQASALNTTLANAQSEQSTAQATYKALCSDDTAKQEEKCKTLKETLTKKELAVKAASTEILDFEQDFNSSGRTTSNLVNIKATVTEVGDVDKFWKALAFTSETLQPTIEEYVQTKSKEVTKNYTTEEQITNSNNELNYQIATLNFDTAYEKFKALDDKDEGYVDAKIACLTKLKVLTEAGINAGKATIQTCD